MALDQPLDCAALFVEQRQWPKRCMPFFFVTTRNAGGNVFFALLVHYLQAAWVLQSFVAAVKTRVDPACVP